MVFTTFIYLVGARSTCAPTGLLLDPLQGPLDLGPITYLLNKYYNSKCHISNNNYIFDVPWLFN